MIVLAVTLTIREKFYQGKSHGGGMNELFVPDFYTVRIKYGVRYEKSLALKIAVK